MTRSITEIIDYARLAPSVHNVQPWRFSIEQNDILIFIETSRILHDGDQTKRELWITMGACIEAVLTAAKGLGFSAELRSSQANDIDSPVAIIHVERAGSENPKLLQLLEERHSYRETLAPAKTDGLVTLCRKQISDLSSVEVIVTHDDAVKTMVADIALRGMKIALSSKSFRNELGPLLHTNWSNAKTGLHGYVMGLGTLGSVWQKLSVAFGVDRSRQGKADAKRVLEASELIFITSKGDIGPYWLDAGRAYFRLAILLTEHGFAHSTLTAPIEGGRFHEDIEQLLGTEQRILCLLRVGKATIPVKGRSPRLSTEELIGS